MPHPRFAHARDKAPHAVSHAEACCSDCAPSKMSALAVRSASGKESLAACVVKLTSHLPPKVSQSSPGHFCAKNQPKFHQSSPGRSERQKTHEAPGREAYGPGSMLGFEQLLGEAMDALTRGNSQTGHGNWKGGPPKCPICVVRL